MTMLASHVTEVPQPVAYPRKLSPFSIEMGFFQSVSTTGGTALATATIFPLFREYCGFDMERNLDLKT